MNDLEKQLRNTLDIEGDVLECGVYRGGSALNMAKILKNSDKEFHIFDSFCGMPEVSEYDNRHKKGDFSDVSLKEVECLLKDFDVSIHVGFVPDTFNEVSHLDKISFVHLDLDLYDGYKSTLEFTYPLLQKDGIIVFDDYGAGSCAGAKKAVDDFLLDKPEKPIKLSKFQYMIKKK